MATKESSRNSGVLLLLERKRGEIPAVDNVRLDRPIVSDGSLLKQIEGFKDKPEFYKLSALIAICEALTKTCLRVSDVRYNRWGKVELLLLDYVNSLKQVKATPEEIQDMAWLQFPGYDEDQKQFLNEWVNNSISSRDGPRIPFYVKLLQLNLVKDNNEASVTDGPLAKKKTIVYGRWQIVRQDAPMPPIVPASGGSSGGIVFTGSDIGAEEVAAKAAKKSKKAPSDGSGEPPKKRSKKGGNGSPGGGGDVPVTEGPTSSQAVHFDMEEVVKE